ncbi:MAG TPA: acyl-CoA carboxylase subunit epsilon [Jatrophihabitans sp.]|nr:acyl-CoA carboxylase subunit epsilon [Jatrophihabitans sp.]
MTAERPLLHIVGGNPTPEEVAAVTVVLTALSGEQEPPGPETGGAWSDLSLRLRRPLPPGPGAWRASTWS